jgi:hypothetical protein
MEAPMRKSTFVLAVLFLVAIVWMGLQGNSPHAADAPAGVQKFEYKTTTWASENDSTRNALGDQGWDLCAVIPGKQLDNSVLIFKRPKQ